MTMRTFVRLHAALALMAIMSFGICSCTEEIDTTNRYTFKGETVGSFLESNPEQYSDITYILQRGGKLSLLKAYGVYTLFAPTNDAVERYLVEQDSIWRESLKPGSKMEIWTGITSPVLEELTDSMCEVISKTHILTIQCMTMDMQGDVIPSTNLNSRFLTLAFGVDEELHSTISVNGARIVLGDQEMENGVVHTLDKVLNPSSRSLAAEIDGMKFLSIFNEALRQTGLDQALEPYKDFSYTEGDKLTADLYNGNIDCHYPPNRFYGFTAFCEPDEVYHEAGIMNVDDLAARCRDWYPTATDPDPKSENNALHKFVSYHLMDRRLPYSRLICYQIACTYFTPSSASWSGVFASEMKFSPYADRFDYFETMQGTVVKVIMPRSNRKVVTKPDGSQGPIGDIIFLNYAKDLINEADPFNSTAGKADIPVNIRVLNPSELDGNHYPGYVTDALNGNTLLIDHLLVYDEDVMSGYILNEMIRIDIASLIPEFTNNYMRWYSGADIEFGNTAGLFYVPDHYSDRIRIRSAETRLYYMGALNSWNQYQGDLMSCKGMFDIAYRLPHVPAGTYELRVGYVADADRGIVQYYVDDEITGIPVNMRLVNTDPRIGWIADAETPDNGITNDKEMKNRGYLKGPNTYYMGDLTTTARNFYRAYRLVLTTKYFGEGDHWVRIKNVNENDVSTDRFMHDYFELVPVGWMRREDIPEEDRRK